MIEEYLVTWSIDIEADSPREAAEKALRIMLKVNPYLPDSATVFEVKKSTEPNKTHLIDLSSLA